MEIKKLTPDQCDDWLRFFDGTAFSDHAGEVKETLVWQKKIEFSGAYNEDGYVMRQHEI